MTAIHSAFEKSPVFAPGDPRIPVATRAGISYTIDFSREPYKRMEKERTLNVNICNQSWSPFLCRL
jgi:hypothetical protein